MKLKKNFTTVFGIKKMCIFAANFNTTEIHQIKPYF